MPNATERYESFTFDQTRALLPSASDDAHEITLYLQGNYWQNSRQYVGPKPQPSAGYLAGMIMLERSFVALPKLGEVLWRHVRGVVGREPAFEVVLPQDNQSLKATIDDAQGDWWDERNAHETAQKFTSQLRAYGRACLRYDIPPGLLDSELDESGQVVKTGIKSGATWQDVLNKVHLEVPEFGSAYVVTDPRSMRKIGVFFYSEESETEYSIATKSGAKIECVQLSFVDDDGMTVVRTIRNNGTQERHLLDCGGQILILQAEMRPLLSKTLRGLVNTLNSNCTMIKLNEDLAGFPEQINIDMVKPQAIVPDNAGGTKKVDVPLQSGPRVSKFLYSYAETDANGNAIVDKDGKPVVRQAQLIFREPVSSEPLRQDARFWEEAIYKEVQQLHVLISGDATASGVSRVEARSDFADSLLETKPKVEGVLRAMLRGTLCMAAHLASDTMQLQVFKDARMRVDCQLNAGPLSVEERTEIITRFQAKLLSRETALVLLGVEDVGAELTKIEDDQTKQTLAELGDGFRSADDKPSE